MTDKPVKEGFPLHGLALINVVTNKVLYASSDYNIMVRMRTTASVFPKEYRVIPVLITPEVEVE